MNKNQAKILATSVYQSIQNKKGKELEKVIDNFSSYLSDHHLISMIPNILLELEKIYFADQGIVAAKVSSKEKLADGELKKIETLVKNKTKQTVVVKSEEDESLIGGAVIKYNDKIIDMSLRQQLSNLAKQLSN